MKMQLNILTTFLMTLSSLTLLGQKNIPLANSSVNLTYQPIDTPNKRQWYLNAQNLVSTWNNLIIHSKTGDDQIKLMRESGVFDENIKLSFVIEGEKMEFNGLTDKSSIEFYNSFVNTLKKERYNIASNIEAVEFGDDFFRFNFKHWLFFNERLSVVGENQCVMIKKDGSYTISSADINVILFDAGHGY